MSTDRNSRQSGLTASSDVQWVDNSTFLSKTKGKCFFCGTPTFRVDINYDGYYCGLDDTAIAEDLRRLNDRQVRGR